MKFFSTFAVEIIKTITPKSWKGKQLMLTKGSKEYKMAQRIANKLEDYASVERIKQSGWFMDAFYNVEDFLNDIKKLNVFASEIAKTVANSMDRWGDTFKVARISSKQAWILACAAVENNIELM